MFRAYLVLGKKLCHFGPLCRRLQTNITPHYGEFVNKQTNILLIGSPGSGKTTVARILGSLLERPALDIDDDHLEPYWNMPVEEKLSSVGDERFIEEEGNALMTFSKTGHVVSLTGSNPMHEESMTRIAKSGVVVFLDCESKDILGRLQNMKVNRIVGHKDNMADTLAYRQQFYEKHYDIRIVCEEGESPESIAIKTKESLETFAKDRGYVSTRGGTTSGARVPFFHTVLKGLAEDGGLYTRYEPFPRFTKGQLKRLVPLECGQRAQRILERFLHPSDLDPQSLGHFTKAAYGQGAFETDDVFPVRHLAGNQYVLELFHGPTASFKDGALQLMPHFFSAAVQDNKQHEDRKKYLILVATSGDTGGAVLDGYKQAGKFGVSVMVLYPSHGISQLQKHQMTTTSGRNLNVTGVNGDFDFCQSTVKRLFQDVAFTTSLLNDYSLKLSAANSLNWGRLIPQVVYHVSGYLDLVKTGVISLGEEIDVCVPTGNFGNILAAYFAREIGLPIRRLICASNSNHVLTDFFNTGEYDLRSRSLQHTSSPAIDILRSSNLERLVFYLMNKDGQAVQRLYRELDNNQTFSVSTEVLERLQGMFKAGTCNEQECKEAIVSTFKQTGYLMDPHTAIAKAVADKFNDRKCPVLISGTAHFAKFADSILPFLGDENVREDTPVSYLIEKSMNLNAKPKMHKQLLEMVSKPVVHRGQCSAEYDSIKNHVRRFAERLNS